jgi:hypothetical protein
MVTRQVRDAKKIRHTKKQESVGWRKGEETGRTQKVGDRLLPQINKPPNPCDLLPFQLVRFAASGESRAAGGAMGSGSFLKVLVSNLDVLAGYALLLSP